MKLKKSLFCLSALSLCALAVSACKKEKADIKVGILQFATFDALDNATNGFKGQIEAAASKNGKTVEFIVENPEGDTTLNQSMATKLVRECDLVLGNATPCAVALKTAAATQGKPELPILFTSVSDPVAEKLVSSMDDPSNNGQLTGTSDINPVVDQIDMIVDLFGDNCKIGYLYTNSESNSKTQCDAADRYIAQNYPNVTTTTALVSEGAADVTTIARNLASNVDALYIPTDNNMAKNMTAVTNATNALKKPVFCGEGGMVDSGGTFSISISYLELGKTTGDMAVEILFNGKNPNQIKPESQTNSEFFTNVKNDNVIAEIELVLPESFKTKYGF